jgi:transformation/transcription domain-associated protein
MEEGFTLPQLAHVWAIVVRHSCLFRDYHRQLVPQMFYSLPRIGPLLDLQKATSSLRHVTFHFFSGLPLNASYENRRLGVDMAELLVEWELDFHEDMRSRYTLSCNVVLSSDVVTLQKFKWKAKSVVVNQ